MWLRSACLPTFDLFAGNRPVSGNNIHGRLRSTSTEVVCRLPETCVAYKRSTEGHTRAVPAWVTAGHNIWPSTSSHPGHIRSCRTSSTDCEPHEQHFRQCAHAFFLYRLQVVRTMCCKAAMTHDQMVSLSVRLMKPSLVLWLMSCDMLTALLCIWCKLCCIIPVLQNNR